MPTTRQAESCPLGFRSWEVSNHELISPIIRTPWTGPRLRAKNWTNKGALRGKVGIHAALGMDGDFPPGNAYGIVRVADGADYVLGEEGWRAEEVEILRLYVASKFLIRELQARYGVSVELLPRVHPTAEVHPSAWVHPTARIAERARVGAHVWVFSRATIGAEAVVGHHAAIWGSAVIGDGAVIGDYADIRCRARIGRRARIGKNARVDENARVEDGGVVPDSLEGEAT